MCWYIDQPASLRARPRGPPLHAATRVVGMSVIRVTLRHWELLLQAGPFVGVLVGAKCCLVSSPILRLEDSGPVIMHGAERARWSKLCTGSCAKFIVGRGNVGL